MALINKIINTLRRKQQEKLREKDVGGKNVKQLHDEVNDIEKEIKQRTQQLLEDKEEIGEISMTKETKEKKTKKTVKKVMKKATKKKVAKKKVAKKVTPVKAKRTSKESSYTAVIIETLKLKSVKKIDTAVERVNKIKTGRNDKQNRSHIKVIISLIKNQKFKRLNKYSWDEKKFLLTEK